MKTIAQIIINLIICGAVFVGIVYFDRILLYFTVRGLQVEMERAEERR